MKCTPYVNSGLRVIRTLLNTAINLDLIIANDYKRDGLTELLT